jgi:predicted transcriptional regulator
MAKQVKPHKRTYRIIRHDLLTSLASGQKNINQLANTSGINWKTTQNHLIYLCGFRFARVVVNLPQVKIYEITERGMEELAK